MRRIVAAAAWIGLASVAVANDRQPSLRVSVPYVSGDIGEVSSFEAVQTPQFLLKSTSIDHRGVELYCSRQWSGVVAKIDGRLYALNDEAIRAVQAGMTATSDSAPIDIRSYKAEGGPFFGHDEAAASLSERSRKQCNPDASSPAPLKTASDSLGSAYALCETMEASGILTKPCEVSGSAIRATIDVRSSEAKAICAELVQATKNAGVQFERGWKIEIFSPYSGSSSIAYCDFR